MIVPHLVSPLNTGQFLMNIPISDNKALLAKYLPAESVEDIYRFIVNHKVQFKIVGERATRLGDYRFLPPDKHRITINNNLNPYLFLFVTLHEFAHLKTSPSYYNRKRLKPHGEEWKAEFRELLTPFMERNIFPKELNEALQLFVKNPSASTISTAGLLKEFQRHNPNNKEKNTPIIRVEDIPENGLFTLKGIVFRKLKKRRTRYMCERIQNSRMYLVHGLAEVEIV